MGTYRVLSRRFLEGQTDLNVQNEFFPPKGKGEYENPGIVRRNYYWWLNKRYGDNPTLSNVRCTLENLWPYIQRQVDGVWVGLGSFEHPIEEEPTYGKQLRLF